MFFQKVRADEGFSALNVKNNWCFEQRFRHPAQHCVFFNIQWQRSTPFKSHKFKLCTSFEFTDTLGNLPCLCQVTSFSRPWKDFKCQIDRFEIVTKSLNNLVNFFIFLLAGQNWQYVAHCSADACKNFRFCCGGSWGISPVAYPVHGMFCRGGGLGGTLT